MQAAPLRALGWVEGRNLLIERRYAERAELLGPLAQELRNHRPADAAVAGGSGDSVAERIELNAVEGPSALAAIGQEQPFEGGGG